MKTIDLSVVIPTLNEELYIGELLDSLVKQTVSPKEIVIVDAYSKDKTISEIKKRQKILKQLKFYQIPKSTISKQRNFGVSKTNSPHILFLDADMSFKDPQTLEKYFTEVLETEPDIAAAFNWPSTEYWKDKAFFAAMNALFVAAKPIWPMATAMNIYVKREVFLKSGEFDEQIRVGEDYELIQRCVRKGNEFKFLKTPKLHTSTRRFEKEGRRTYTFKMVKSFFNIMTKGYKRNEIEYEFGKFTSKR